MQEGDFVATDVKRYNHDGDLVVVEVMNTEKAFAWRMIVNGKTSEHTSHYQGVLCFANYRVVTDYWDGTFKPWVPFLVDYSKKASNAKP